MDGNMFSQDLAGEDVLMKEVSIYLFGKNGDFLAFRIVFFELFNE